MAFLLGYGSAVEWLLRNHSTELLDTYYNLPYACLEGSRRQFERFAQAELEPLTKPIQLIVWNKTDRRRTALTNCHVLNIRSGAYPAVRIKRMLFCSTPELVFVQMANVLDAERLRFLGMELCGRFGIDGDVFLRSQKTTPGMLAEQARALPGVHGRAKALEVAPLVIGGAASPMEIALTLMLCASRDQGGYGLPTPDLNRPIPVQGEARQFWDEDFITPDLQWQDARLAIEYDSDLYHSATHRIARDALRRSVLEELGYRVITVTGQHMRTPNQLERIARVVARALGVELAIGDEDEQRARIAFQLRMRRLGMFPSELLAIAPHKSVPKRGWHARR